MKIHDVQQLTPEWFDLRKGLPTASSFDRILTPKTAKPASAAEEYLCELVAERLCLVPPAERPMNAAMRHGVDFEDEAREWFKINHDGVEQVGFVTTDDGRFGCSPDGLLWETTSLGKTYTEGLELKCPQGKTHVQYLMDGGLPAAYRCQVHGCLIVTGLPRWHFVSYAPGLPPLHVVVEPDEFTDRLRAALEEFDSRLQSALARFRPAAKEAA